MANNLLELKCMECGVKFRLAKYYPSSGWYTSLALNLDLSLEESELDQDHKDKALEWFENLQNWLEAHSHNAESNMYGQFFDLEYEVPREEPSERGL